MVADVGGKWRGWRWAVWVVAAVVLCGVVAWGIWGRGGGAPPQKHKQTFVYQDVSRSMEERAADLVGHMTLEEKIRRCR